MVNSIFVSTIIYLFIAIKIFYNTGGNWGYLITLGDQFVDKTKLSFQVSVLPNSAGYDGEFYYRYALNPFNFQKQYQGITVDNPPYRYQRIFYPLLVWILSFGNGYFVPFWMFFVNIISLCLIGIIGPYVARAYKQHPLWGIIFALAPGIPIILVRDLTEILEITLLLAGIFLFKTKRLYLSVISFSLAVLTKETALIISLFLLITNFKKRILILPIIIFSLWQIVGFIIWKQLPLTSGASSFDLPLKGISEFIYQSLQGQYMKFLLDISILMIFSYTIMRVLLNSTAEKYIKFSWVIYFVMALTFSRAIWFEGLSYLRVLSEFYILGVLIVLTSKMEFRAYIFVLLALLFMQSAKPIL